MKFKILSILLFSILTIPIALSVDVSDCTVLNIPGATYYLTSDIIDSSATTCFNIIADDVTFNGMGHTVDGIEASPSFGINISAINVTVLNVSLRDWRNNAITLIGADNCTIHNISIKRASVGTYGNGISLSDGSDNNTFYNNIINASANSIYFGETDSGSDNHFYNNYFGNLIYIRSDYVGTNYWNTTQKTGTKIIGTGSLIGGNYWGRTNHLVSLESMCTDGNLDGFCDTPYDVENELVCNLEGSKWLCEDLNNVDYLPIIDNGTTNGCGVLSISGRSYTLDSSMTTSSRAIPCVDITGDDITFDLLGNEVRGSNPGVAIEFDLGSTNNTVKNGSARAQVAISLAGTSNTVEDMHIRATGTYALNMGGISHTINNNIFEGYLGGLYGTCKNCNITNNVFDNLRAVGGVEYIYGVFNTTFENNTFEDEYLYIQAQSDNLTVKNNKFKYYWGIRISIGNWALWWANDTYIYNNFFNCSVAPITLYAHENSQGINNLHLNTTKQLGNRIYSGGTLIGGNYYTNLTGNGYSDICEDTDKDGFCDTPYTPYIEGNISKIDAHDDYLPLSDEYQFDSDNDGIPDSEDECPYEDSTGFDADQDGCIDTFDGLTDIINTLPDDVLSDEIKNSLVSKVENALNSDNRENDEAAINQLQAFINQVEAQRGKKISEEVADMLIEYANNLIELIQAGQEECETDEDCPDEWKCELEPPYYYEKIVSCIDGQCVYGDWTWGGCIKAVQLCDNSCDGALCDGNDGPCDSSDDCISGECEPNCACGEE